MDACEDELLSFSPLSAPSSSRSNSSEKAFRFQPTSLLLPSLKRSQLDVRNALEAPPRSHPRSHSLLRAPKHLPNLIRPRTLLPKLGHPHLQRRRRPPLRRVPIRMVGAHGRRLDEEVVRIGGVAFLLEDPQGLPSQLDLLLRGQVGDGVPKPLELPSPLVARLDAFRA